ncbi:hypothetical protein ACFV6W_17545, partial [Streptomyces sp. NPDC059802]
PQPRPPGAGPPGAPGGGTPAPRAPTGPAAAVAHDGRGGARVRADGGLAGLRRRLAAFDGTLEITSPAGGPTRARIVVPCESL